jgi:phosphatidate phosphatase PAH1
MNYVEKFFDGVQSVLNVNAATFSGACDIIVVRRVSHKPDCVN